MTVNEQSEEQSRNSNLASRETTAEWIRKKASKFKSVSGKSRFNMNRSKSNLSETNNNVDITKISNLFDNHADVTVVSVDDLKDGYYRDLRLLLPPTDLDESQRGIDGTVDDILREMHDAIDEMNRSLDNVNLPMFDLTGVPETSCMNVLFKNRLSKPDTGIDMKTCRPKRKTTVPSDHDICNSDDLDSK